MFTTLILRPVSLIRFRFHIFFHHIDHYRTDAFLWVTATGISAAAKLLAKGDGKRAGQKVDIDSDDEVDAGGEEG